VNLISHVCKAESRIKVELLVKVDNFVTEGLLVSSWALKHSHSLSDHGEEFVKFVVAAFLHEDFAQALNQPRSSCVVSEVI
jgi:hypothetical protein